MNLLQEYLLHESSFTRDMQLIRPNLDGAASLPISDPRAGIHQFFCVQAPFLADLIPDDLFYLQCATTTIWMATLPSVLSMQTAPATL